MALCFQLLRTPNEKPLSNTTRYVKKNNLLPNLCGWRCGGQQFLEQRRGVFVSIDPDAGEPIPAVTPD